MTGSYRAVEQPVAGFDHLQAITLAGPEDDAAALSSTWIPGAGMVGSSLRHRGEEVLGQRGGLGAYLSDAKTFGIPLLAPWANRLAADSYTVGGHQVDVDHVHGVHRDGNGLPIHGLLAGARDWTVTDLVADDAGARLVAELEFDHQRPEFSAFPFAHQLQVVVELSGATVAVTTIVTPTADRPVPIAFGWHPYFTLPGVPREQWQVGLPFTAHVVLDDRNLPTGEVTEVAAIQGDLGSVELDDLYTDVDAGTEAWLAGGGRRIGLTYATGYDYAVLYAPAGQPLLAIEPMTAATNPFAGPFDVQYAVPGSRYVATFTISVTDTEEAV